MPPPAGRRPKPRANEVPAYGPVRSRLYVLGERAGAEEDRRGVPFVGPSGQSLREWFESAGLELDKARRWNVCIDYKPGNLKPWDDLYFRKKSRDESDEISYRARRERWQEITQEILEPSSPLKRN